MLRVKQAATTAGLRSVLFWLAACGGAGNATPVGDAASSTAVGGASNIAGAGAGVGVAMSAGMTADSVAGTGTASQASTSVPAGAAAGRPAMAPGGAGALDLQGTAGNASMDASTLPTGGAGTAASSAAGASGTGDAAAQSATFTAVFNLLAGGCATGGYCHASGGGPSKLALVDQSVAYMDLVGVSAMGNPVPGSMTMGCATSTLTRVKAGDPDNSLLMQKLEGKQTCGDQMPPGGSLRPEELSLVREWIMAGARND